MKASSVLASAVLAAALVFGGLWVLENTTPGLNIKCRVFKDLGACLLVAFSAPAAPSLERSPVYPPQPTENPQERAAREAREGWDQLDAAVRTASNALSLAIDGLEASSADLGTAADEVAAAVGGVTTATNEGMAEAYAALKEQTQVKPMDEFAQNDVCYALNDVEYALNDVEYSRNDFDYAAASYATAVDRASASTSAVATAIDDLKHAEAANPAGLHAGGSSAPTTLEDGARAVAQAKQGWEAVESKVAASRSEVGKVLKASEGWMSKAKKLAETVADC